MNKINLLCAAIGLCGVAAANNNFGMTASSDSANSAALANLGLVPASGLMATGTYYQMTPTATRGPVTSLTIKLYTGSTTCNGIVYNYTFTAGGQAYFQNGVTYIEYDPGAYTVFSLAELDLDMSTVTSMRFIYRNGSNKMHVSQCFNGAYYTAKSGSYLTCTSSDDCGTNTNLIDKW